MTAERPWLKLYAKNLAAAEPPPKERLRPLIYVYDLPSDFNTRLLQVCRHFQSNCNVCSCPDNRLTCWCT